MAPNDLITALHRLWNTSPSLWLARQEDVGGWPGSRRREDRKRTAVLSWCVWGADNVTVTQGWPRNTRSIFHDVFLLSVTRRRELGTGVRAGRDCWSRNLATRWPASARHGEQDQLHALLQHAAIPIPEHIRFPFSTSSRLQGDLYTIRAWWKWETLHSDPLNYFTARARTSL